MVERSTATLVVDVTDLEILKEALRWSRAVAYSNMIDPNNAPKTRGKSRRVFQVLGGWMNQLAPETKAGYRLYDTNAYITVGEMQWFDTKRPRWHILDSKTGEVLSEYETYAEAKAAFAAAERQTSSELPAIAVGLVSNVDDTQPTTQQRQQ